MSASCSRRLRSEHKLTTSTTLYCSCAVFKGSVANTIIKLMACSHWTSDSSHIIVSKLKTTAANEDVPIGRV